MVGSLKNILKAVFNGRSILSTGQLFSEQNSAKSFDKTLFIFKPCVSDTLKTNADNVIFVSEPGTFSERKVWLFFHTDVHG